MQASPRSLRPCPLLLDYGDTRTPHVTHTRGILIAGSRAGLSELGFYEQYAELLPAKHKDALLYCVASSWIPIDLTMTHFETCDRLGMSTRHFDAIGATLAERLTKTFIAVALKSVRFAGADGQIVWAMSHFDRLLKRIYCGGSCRIEQHGPKELLLELRGIPFANSTYYRGVVLSQSKVLLGLMCRSLFVHFARPRAPRSDTLALSLNWV